MLLIDSGADVTLLPRNSINSLGIGTLSNEGYELMSFDGSVSVAPAVQIDLLFLKRTFKGRFLVIDQEWGILGRDILNHLAILLDGPTLTWNEQRAILK